MIGNDIHRAFGEVVIGDEGKLHRAARVDMTRTALEGFGKKQRANDPVVIEATGNCMAVSQGLSPFVAKVMIANPLQVKAITHPHVETDKIDAGIRASSYKVCAIRPNTWVYQTEVFPAEELLRPEGRPQNE